MNTIKTKAAKSIMAAQSLANDARQAVSAKVDALKIGICNKTAAAKAQLSSAGATAYSALTSSVTKKGVMAFTLVALAGSFTAFAIMMLNELRSKVAPKGRGRGRGRGRGKAPTEQLSMKKLKNTAETVLRKKEFNIALAGSALGGAFAAGCATWKEDRHQRTRNWLGLITGGRCGPLTDLNTGLAAEQEAVNLFRQLPGHELPGHGLNYLSVNEQVKEQVIELFGQLPGGDLNYLSVNEAATKVQARYRGMQTRKAEAEAKAATKVQARYRGMQTRKAEAEAKAAQEASTRRFKRGLGIMFLYTSFIYAATSYLPQSANISGDSEQEGPMCPANIVPGYATANAAWTTDSGLGLPGLQSVWLWNLLNGTAYAIVGQR